MSDTKLKHLQESFFKTVFSLLGHIANCDGYVNRDEIKRTQTFMAKMKLSEECKREAIVLFREGSSPQFNMAELLEEFSAAAERTPTIIEVLLVYLISLARIDGLLVEKEIKVVRQVAAGLKYSNIIFDHLLKMVAAQDKFVDQPATDASQSKNSTSSHNGDSSSGGDNVFGSGGQTSQGKQKDNLNENRRQGSASGKSEQENYFTQVKTGADLTAAYEALGVSPNIDDEALKRAYRKLVSQFHPDKLQGQGLPPELINTATDRFKKIQGAYDYIKKHRK